MLHNMEGSADGSTTPSGFVVANDADAQRCNLLTHQTKRMCSPCLMVTNHNGEQFPRITGLQPAPGSAAAAAAAAEAAAAGSAAQQQQQQGDGEVMLFDRILCDVPCSGDGTMRKAPDIWRRWSVNNGNGLHNMQLRIALHAVRLLKVCCWDVLSLLKACAASCVRALLFACYQTALFPSTCGTSILAMHPASILLVVIT
jgi:16S rRNA C967 or C1407 C5-methylase (RsmB/RsmF family)